MTYLKHESIYFELMGRFARGEIGAREFEKHYIAQWNNDRDAQWASVQAGSPIDADEIALGEILDQAFTACDCYSPAPSSAFDISEEQLKAEIEGLFVSRWGSNA